MVEFVAYRGHALDLGTFTITPSAGSLVGSRAILRIGKSGQLALLEFESDSPPAEGVFTWDDSTGALVVDLAASHVDTLDVGNNFAQVTIEKADGTPLKGPTSMIVVNDVVRDI